MTRESLWINQIRDLLADPPKGWRLYAMGETLYAAGAKAQAVIGDSDPASVGSHALAASGDWTPLGRITDSGGW